MMRKSLTLVVFVILTALLAGGAGRGKAVTGRITDASTGQGIAGVAVTDGFNYVTTDSRGKYKIRQDPRSKGVYYTTPAGYEINLDPRTHLPLFYSRDGYDFQLWPLSAPETDFTLFMVGDPQCYKESEVSRYEKETVADMKMSMKKYNNVYAITLGDITFDNTGLWDEMAGSMSNVMEGERYLPFFQCIGNHDHDSLEQDTEDDASDDLRATAKYYENFGPTDYSFDRGNAHIVVMDDVMVNRIRNSNKPNNHTWGYVGGFSESQYNWLRQDLALVDKPEEKLLIFCCHIPFRGGSKETGASVSRKRFHDEILSLMTQFRECHLMMGHTHYQQNYIHRNFVCAGGQPIYEHVHGGACGAWWTVDSNVTGGPNGYSIYSISGANVTDWHMKGANRPDDYQLRVYLGDQQFTGSKGYAMKWSDKEVPVAGGCTVKGLEAAAGSLVAEVFDDDDANWKVEMYVGGKKVGDFVRASSKGSTNVPLSAFWFNEKGKTTKTWCDTSAAHFWTYPLPEGGLPQGGWEVRATLTVPTNPKQVNVYTCNRLTIDYSEY